MVVTVFLPQVLRASAGGAARLEVDVTGAATLGEVLDEIALRYPALERRLRDERRTLRRYVNFYVDGEECRALGGSGAEVAEHAEIRVLPSVAGG